MQIGLIGLPLSGKSTLFDLLTGGEASRAGPAQLRVGVARVPDARLEFLAELFQPRRVVSATIQFTDLVGFLPGRSDRAKVNAFLEGVRRSDALVHVIRVFETPALPHPLGGVDPVRDARDMETELLLADLQAVESAQQRLAAARKKSPEDQARLELLERCRATLEEERPLRELALGEEAWRLLRGYAFLTARPTLVAVNLSEEQLRAGDYPGRDQLAAFCARLGEEPVEFCGTVELEIAALPEADRPAFLAEFGLAEPGIARLARAAYRAVGLISFLTAGEDEVRAWPIRRGSTAREAAGKVHSDMERGFIRAEVIAFDALRAAGSVRAARERGAWRLEGRDYVMQDGDVVTFRFAT